MKKEISKGKLKNTGGTLVMIPSDWALKFLLLLYRTLNSRMNTIETRAVSNIIQKTRKICSGGQTGGPRYNLNFLFYAKLNAKKLNSTMIIKKVSTARVYKI